MTRPYSTLDVLPGFRNVGRLRRVRSTGRNCTAPVEPEQCPWCHTRVCSGKYRLCNTCRKLPEARASLPPVVRTPHTPCVYCGQRVGSRPGQLCDPCYADPELRVRFPGRGNGGRITQAPLPDHAPAEPLRHPPGSPWRIAELMARVERREYLWREDDVKPDED